MNVNRITLYIPAYNAGGTIEQCLTEVRSMTRLPDEILVIDDGSEDESAAKAERMGARVVRHPVNRGIAAARNSALREARYPLIANLDADAIPAPDWLEKLVGALDERIVGVGGKLIEKHRDDLVNRWRAVHMAQHWGDKIVEDPTFLSGAGALFRRSVLEAMGGYDERCRTNFEDNDLGLRMRDAGHHIRYIPDAIIWHLRRDTLSSLLMTCWRWTRRPRDATSLNFKIRKILVNFITLGRKMRRDWDERSLALFGLSLLVTANNCLMDSRFFLTGREDAWWKPRRKSA